MNIAQKQLQVQTYVSTLAGMVLEMDQNELDFANNIPMTKEPYRLRFEILSLNEKISFFSVSELPSLSRIQQEALPTITGSEFNINGTPISLADGQTLTVSLIELRDALKSTITRFNLHLVNLRPRCYPRIPSPISL